MDNAATPITFFYLLSLFTLSSRLLSQEAYLSLTSLLS